MARPQPSVAPAGRTGTTLAAVLLGLPAAAALLWVLLLGPLRHSVAHRYVSHSVEWVEVVMFCVALGALGTKMARFLVERRACSRTALPPWDGKPVPVSEAAPLLDRLRALPRSLQQSLIVQRAAAVLEFLSSRGSAHDLDDHLRTLADNDSLALEGSYAFTRFITWAIPILGFLGTVLGITGAISGVTPEQLEHNLSTVTDGLALAFDATALALGLTMVTMFLNFLVERAEQSVLDRVDRYTDQELAHRFQREGPQTGAFVEVVQRQTQVLVQAVDQVVRRQAALWAEALERTEQGRHEAEHQQQDRFVAALQKVLEQMHASHEERLTGLEEKMLARSQGLVDKLADMAKAVQEASAHHTAAALEIGQQVSAQAETWARLQEGEKHLRRLQETLNQNLAALAGAGAFEQVLHNLTAAIHLLTSRSPVVPPAAATRLGPRSGGAAA